MTKNKAKKIRVAINGFGRIGRQAFKIALDKKNIEVVALNDLTDTKTLAHLLTYDTVYGKYDKKVTSDNRHIIISRKKFLVTAQPEPKKLPWKKLKIDVVLESTGRFVKDGAARAHLKAGAKKVIISAPSKGSSQAQTFVKGVNDHQYKSQDIVSNASCTTNCISPVIRVMADNFGVEKAMMTTVHGYTADQRLQDAPHRDLRRARAAAQNTIPTTTGAAIATTKALPELAGKFDGIAIRVPVIVGSLSDFTILTSKEVTPDKINSVFKKAEKNPIYAGIIKTTSDPVVSSDIIRDSHSAIIDLNFTRVVGGNMAKVLAWYDNEWGYANRLVEMIDVVSN
jgi:glyceraldehyde 3-phosphate dehydrogenase